MERAKTSAISRVRMIHEYTELVIERLPLKKRWSNADAFKMLILISIAALKTAQPSFAKHGGE